jgi:hypothetical protein
MSLGRKGARHAREGARYAQPAAAPPALRSSLSRPLHRRLGRAPLVHTALRPLRPSSSCCPRSAPMRHGPGLSGPPPPTNPKPTLTGGSPQPEPEASNPPNPIACVFRCPGRAATPRRLAAPARGGGARIAAPTARAWPRPLAPAPGPRDLSRTCVQAPLPPPAHHTPPKSRAPNSGGRGVKRTERAPGAAPTRPPPTPGRGRRRRRAPLPAPAALGGPHLTPLSPLQPLYCPRCLP